MSRLIVLFIPSGIISLAIGGNVYYLVFSGIIFTLLLANLLVDVGLKPGCCKYYVPIRRVDIYLIIFLAIIFVAYFRGAHAGVIQLEKALGLTFLWVLIAIFFFSKRKDRKILQAIFDSVILYSLINLFLYVLGVEAPNNPYGENTGTATFLKVLGIEANRVLFPLTLGVNGFGVIAGLAFCFSAIRWAGNKSPFNTLIACLCLITLILSDSRGAMGGALISLFTSVLIYWFKLKPWLVRYSVILAYPTVTIMILGFSLLVGSILVSNGLSRGEDILSGRGVIWQGVLTSFASFDYLGWIFGFGYLGQVHSGASSTYESLFYHLNMLHPEYMSAHSSFLQNMLDIGILGIIFLFLVVNRLLKTISIKNLAGSNVKWSVYCFVIYSIVVGATDLTLNQNNLVLFYVLLALGACIGRCKGIGKYVS